MDEAVSQIEKLNELLAGSSPYRLGLADPKELVPAEVNARYMTKEQYDQLVQNIKQDGGLSSLPLCWRDARGVNHILSGHHRTRAAVDAGIKQVLYLYTDKDLTEKQRTAIQLSHNAISGQDDLGILRRQWESLKDIELKLYSGLDESDFETYEPVQLATFNEKNLTLQKVELLFLPDDLDVLVEHLQAIAKSKHAQLLASERDFERFADAVMEFKDHANIYNTAIAVMAMAEITEKYCEIKDREGREPSPDEWKEIESEVLSN